MNDQWIQTGALGGRALGGIVRIVADTHRAINRRVDAALPPVARPYHRAQAVTADAVYQTVEAAHVHLPRVLGQVAARTAAPPEQTRVGRALQPVVNGFHGDLIADEHPALAIPLAVRVAGRDADVAVDFPRATPHVVVFLHGLAEDERAWRLGGRPSYGDRVVADGLTAVYVRYNTGRHISRNGQDLARLLDALVRDWPVPVASISLVGHSMGGLVARSACHAGGTWTERVRSVVTLGTPHRGAPLEQAVHVLDSAMRRVPELAPIGRVVAHRSVGIKDLRYGSLLDQDWQDRDVDEFLRNRCREVPFLAHVRYYWVAATLTRDPQHPMGRLVGDGMVRVPSASAVSGAGVRLGDLGHLGLLNDDTVFASLRQWLTAEPVAPLG